MNLTNLTTLELYGNELTALPPEIGKLTNLSTLNLSFNKLTALPLEIGKPMNKFELAYELPDKKSHLVAELLPSTEPEFEWDDTNTMRFYYCYDFLPAGVLTRFIVRVHQDLEYCKNDGKQLCWKEGAMLHQGKTSALVKVKPVERLIEIKINGDKKRELLAIIRYHFDHINSSIKKVKIKEEIPCNCSKDCPHRFNYEQLLYAEKINKETVDCPVNWKEVPLPSLLDGYEKKENRMKEIDKTEKRDGRNYHFENVNNVNISERDMRDIISNPAPPPEAPEKKKSLQDRLGNPASIASYIITLAGILLSFSNFWYAVILVIIGILIFVFLVVLNSKKRLTYRNY